MSEDEVIAALVALLDGLPADGAFSPAELHWDGWSILSASYCTEEEKDDRERYAAVAESGRALLTALGQLQEHQVGHLEFRAFDQLPLDELRAAMLDMRKRYSEVPVGMPPRDLEILEDLLSSLVHVAEKAQQIAPSREKKKKRRPPKHAARAVALATGRAYWGITGRLPKVPVDHRTNTAYGPFLDLVAEVFELLGVDGQPVPHARAACDAIKQEIGPK